MKSDPKTKAKCKVALKEETILQGLGVSVGIAIGPAFVIDQHGVPVPEYCILPNQVEKEIKRFEAAIAKSPVPVATSSK